MVVRRAVRAGVEGVVVVVEEVPAGDVVDEAVAVVVDAVGVVDEDVLGVELGRVAVRAFGGSHDAREIVGRRLPVAVAIVFREGGGLLAGRRPHGTGSSRRC